MVQGQATSKSLAEEFGEVRDLKQLLNAVMEGSFRARSRALTILVYQKGISSRALSDLLCISRRTVEKYCRSYRQGGWKQVLIKKGK